MPRRGFDLTVQMRKDLAKAYRSIYPSCHSQKEAWIKTSRCPAPRYYVSPKRASYVLSLMFRGKFDEVKKMSPIKQKMYYDLFDEVCRLTQKTEYIGKSLWFICQFAVSNPAPQFYISSEALRKAINCSRKYGVSYVHGEVFSKSGR